MAIAFAILEDLPQFSLQNINSAYIGRSLSFIQIFSPVLSFYLLNKRIADNKLGMLTLCCELASYLPILVYAWHF